VIHFGDKSTVQGYILDGAHRIVRSKLYKALDKEGPPDTKDMMMKGTFIVAPTRNWKNTVDRKG